MEICIEDCQLVESLVEADTARLAKIMWQVPHKIFKVNLQLQLHNVDI